MCEADSGTRAKIRNLLARVREEEGFAELWAQDRAAALRAMGIEERPLGTLFRETGDELSLEKLDIEPVH